MNIYQIVLGFYPLMMRPLVNIVSVCVRILLSNDEIFSEHVPDQTSILPSHHETCSEHVFDSMECCVVDELLPGYCIRAISWTKRMFKFKVISYQLTYKFISVSK